MAEKFWSIALNSELLSTVMVSSEAAGYSALSLYSEDIFPSQYS